MAAVSTMVPLGTQATDFRLYNPVTGGTTSLDEVAGENGTLLMFICNHCPYVKHVADELANIGREYLPKGIGVAAINANDAANYPADAPEKMAEEAEQRGYPFPYLFDESQETARAYGAVCTPDFFLFNNNRTLVYRGQLDDSRPGNGVPVTGTDLRSALNSVLAGTPISGEQKASIGCGIKWKQE